MDNSLYSLIFSRSTARLANYTDEERGAFLQKMQEINANYIDETLLRGYCRFSNSHYQHIFFNRLRGGLKELMEGSNVLENIQFYQHFDIDRYLGTADKGAVIDFSPRPRYVDGQPALFKVTLFQNAPGYYQIPKDQMREIFNQRQMCFDDVGQS